jgi:pimeloyl-[acyl-carrier protein] methyl ester esterase
VKLLFVHGWALDRTLWRKLITRMDLGAEAVTPDAGYYGRPFSPPLPEGPILGIGQSLGALELLAEPPPGLVGIVAIDGFARFGQADDFPQGAPARILARMKAKVADGALVEFLQRAGGQPPPGVPDIARLITGLDRLATLDGRACRLPVWRLQAEGDPIAPLAVSDASFAGMDVRERHVRAAGDHLSPAHATDACAALIRTALEALA